MLAAINSSGVMNFTAKTDEQDELIYINRASPNTQLLGKISNASVRYQTRN